MKRFLVCFLDSGNCTIKEYRLNAANIVAAIADASTRFMNKPYAAEVDSVRAYEIRNWKAKP